MARIASLTILFAVFEAVTYITSWQLPVFSATEWVMLAIAGSYGGRCIAYMVIGEPFRFLFTRTVNHPSGHGAYTESKWDSGFMAGIGILFSCPICTGAWVILSIMFLFTYVHHLGYAMLLVFSAAGGAWLLTRFTEVLERLSDFFWEATGAVKFFNRKNNPQEEGEK